MRSGPPPIPTCESCRDGGSPFLGGFVNEPYVRVFVDESIASGVTILGEVKAPGVFPVFGHHDLFDLISLAGGLLPTAGRDVAIQHKADPDHPEVVHLSTSIRPGTSGNVPILPGDKIVVSAAGVVYVLGAVGRPGGFMLSRNEENYSILKLLSSRPINFAFGSFVT